MTSRIFNVDDDIEPYHDFQPLTDVLDLFRVQSSQQSVNDSQSSAPDPFRVKATQQSAGDSLPDIQDKADTIGFKAVPQPADGQDTEMPDVSQSQEIIRETPMAEEPTVSGETLEKEYIEHLLQSDPRPADATPTQGMSSQTQAVPPNQMHPPSHMPISSHKQSVIGEPGASENSNELINTTKLQLLVLSDAKCEELKKKKRRKNKTPKARRARRKDIISCQCGDTVADDGGMLCCDICNEWQHAQCYGYNSVKDPRIPDAHYCYDCLLNGTTEKPLLQSMKDLAFFRHGLSYIWLAEQFPTSIDVLAAEFRMFPHQSHRIIS